jgi:hypothetical protein
VVIVAAVTSPPAAVAANMSRLENIVFHSSLRKNLEQSRHSREFSACQLT